MHRPMRKLLLATFFLCVSFFYIVKSEYQTIGCYKDTVNRAIQILEGKDSALDGSYGSRENPIAKCAVAAKRSGFSMFAVQNGGQCFASSTAPQTFNKYGKSTACSWDGEGGSWANQVYVLKEYQTIGCYKDTANRAIQILEGKDSVLDGSYSSRKNPIAKCAVAAMRAGFSMFAVQNGGWCAASATAPQTFDKYGKSTACKSDGEGGSWANQVYVIKDEKQEYQTIGCYKDTVNRAIQILEGKDSVLDGSYGSRKNPIAKCAVAAMRAGFRMFAVQNGGQCFASSTAPQTFNKYGESTACSWDGEGGSWANQVYVLKEYQTIGCYKDTANQAIQILEGKDSVLDGSYSSRKNPIAKCAVAAMRAGFSMFAVQNGGWCAASATAPQTFDKYGKSTACRSDGEGGWWANQVYVMKDEKQEYQTIGCYKDTVNRAIQILEGKDSVLDGSYGSRKNPIAKCAVAAMRAGFRMFAVQNGGQCFASSTAPQTFNKYGESTACSWDGEGGSWANQVYVLKEYQTIGCYKDTANQAIQILEGKDSVLDGSYSSRKNPIAKCAVAAMRAGFSMFAVQNGGWCAASATAPQTFDKYGKSTACRSDGEGGWWANQVYVMKDEKQEYQTIGCYKDTVNRAIQILEGKDSVLDGSYGSRKNPIAKCAVAAMRAGFRMFAVQNGGQCFASSTAPQTFNKYGKSTACSWDGKGGSWASQVYVSKEYQTIGCYKDTANRAIQILEGKDSVLDGSYSSRKNPIAKCAVAAMRAGFSMFAVQNGGWCAASATAPQTFDKYGKSSACRSDGEGGSWANQVYVLKEYQTIGCYKDTANRAIQILEGKDSALNGSYSSRTIPVAKCAVAAMRAGFSMFAVQYDGQCYASSTAPQTFDKYGKSTACHADGEGGTWANQVYVIKGFATIGCYKDTGNRAIQSLEGKDSVLDGSSGSRKNPIAKCAVAAMRAGFSMFAVQNGGQCYASSTAAQTFDKYGKSTACHADGEGGTWANQVYVMKGYSTIGCYQDTGNRAIQSLEGKYSVLDGSSGSRKNPIAKCAVAAMRTGYSMFAVQYGGQCYASSTAAQTFDKYGKSTACHADGKGGTWANQVYVIKGYATIGCYKDTANRAIQSLEGKDSVLDGSSGSRKNPIEKCAAAAMRAGYKMFAVQYGGQCYASSTATQTFDKYGNSAACHADGEGGTWANQVYLLRC